MNEICFTNPCPGCEVQGLIAPASIRQASATVENVLANKPEVLLRSGSSVRVYAAINEHSQFEHLDRAFGSTDENDAVFEALQRIVGGECESRQIAEIAERN